jgi:hypothetical protein
MSVKGAPVWAYAWRSGPFKRNGFLSCHTVRPAAKFTPMLGAKGLLGGRDFILSNSTFRSRIYFLLYRDVMNHCRWRAAKFTPMLGAQGLWRRKGLDRVRAAKFTPMLNAQGLMGGRDFYRVTHYVPRNFFFSDILIIVGEGLQNLH